MAMDDSFGLSPAMPESTALPTHTEWCRIEALLFENETNASIIKMNKQRRRACADRGF